MLRRQLLTQGASLAIAGPLSWPAAIHAMPAETPERQASMARWRKRLQSILDKGRVPIIDMEATYVASSTQVEKIVAWMDELDVAQVAFAAASAPNSEPSLLLHQQYPDYFIPTTNSGEFARWWNNPTAFVDVLSKDVQSGQYFTMGEHEFRHYPSPEQVAANQTFRDISIAIDSPAAHALFQLSAQSGLAFQIHYEIEDRLLPTLEAMLARYPQARVIWCHLGMVRYPDRATRYGPAYVASLIERFPGLHFDLAVPRSDNIYKPSGVRDSTLYSEGRLAENWQALLEKYPDRFLAASDYRPAIEQHYPANLQRQRNLILNALSEPARHRIAYGNAWRLLTGQAWA